MVYGIIPTSVKLNADLKERIKKLSEIKHRTPHAIMKEAIHAYLKREEKNLGVVSEAIFRWKTRSKQKQISDIQLANWLAHWDHEQIPEPFA